MTGATGYPAYRGYRCVIPGCGRRVAYKRLMCDDDWRTVPVELRAALRDAFRDAVARRPGARDRFHELREQCHQAALDAAGVAPQSGDGTWLNPPVVHPPSRPAAPPAGVPSPHDPPLSGEPSYDATMEGPASAPSQPESPDTASGGQKVVGVDGEVLEGPGESTGTSAQGAPAIPPAGPSAPTTPSTSTQTPAPDPTAGSASPTAGEQAGGGGHARDWAEARRALRTPFP